MEEFAICGAQIGFKKELLRPEKDILESVKVTGLVTYVSLPWLDTFSLSFATNTSSNECIWQ